MCYTVYSVGVVEKGSAGGGGGNMLKPINTDQFMSS